MLDVPPISSTCTAFRSLRLVAILLTTLCWAFAANIAFDLFRAGIHPLELAGVSAMIATFSLAILHSFLGCEPMKPMSLKLSDIFVERPTRASSASRDCCHARTCCRCNFSVALVRTNVNFVANSRSCSHRWCSYDVATAREVAFLIFSSAIAISSFLHLKSKEFDCV